MLARILVIMLAAPPMPSMAVGAAAAIGFVLVRMLRSGKDA
jgi:hypothetical protein